jgi:hypothetical protein
MTEQQIISEFERFSKAEKSAVMRRLLQIFEQDLIEEKTADKSNAQTFSISAFSLCPYREYDFDNIGKLIEETEGDFYK